MFSKTMHSAPESESFIQRRGMDSDRVMENQPYLTSQEVMKKLISRALQELKEDGESEHSVPRLAGLKYKHSGV